MAIRVSRSLGDNKHQLPGYKILFNKIDKGRGLRQTWNCIVAVCGLKGILADPFTKVFIFNQPFKAGRPLGCFRNNKSVLAMGYCRFKRRGG